MAEKGTKSILLAIIVSMIDEDSKTNIIIIYAVIISAVVIGGLALWFFFDSISEREKIIPKEDSDFPVQVKISE